VRGDGADEPILWWDYAGGALKMLHADERGSIIAVSDGLSSTPAINAYDEYGKPAASNIGRMQYTGQMWLPEANLYYYKARNYAPQLGRFVQTDPIGTDGGVNLYAYAANDPIGLIDPSGLAVTIYGPGGAWICWEDGRCQWFSDPTNSAVFVGGERSCGALVCTRISSPQGPGRTSEPGSAPSPGGQTGSRPSDQARSTSCHPNSNTRLGAIADISAKLSEASADLALGSLALAAVTSETVVGGLTFGALATALGAVSAVSGAVSGTARYFNGDRRSAYSAWAGAAVGAVAPPVLSKTLRAATGGERLVTGVGGEAYGRMTASIICQVK